MKKSLALAACLLSLAALAAPPPVGLRLVATGFSQPLGITHAGDGSGRLFVVEKGGRIRIVRAGTVLAAPFLDIAERISTSGERGLLGLAFHPGFAQNRRFYVFYTRREDGALRIAAFLASAANPDLADPASEQALATIPHGSADNHNGGHLAFGPDGFLYAGTGDGGGGGDPDNNGQSLASRLGKLLRLDVETPGAQPQVWAYGLRNPWRFSFDRATGDLFIGDVGQNRFEELDYQPAGTGPGRNYGWRVFEGMECFQPATGCSLADHSPPVLTYGRELGQSITGGYVYRGLRSRALNGYYLYGDFVSNRVWAARLEASGWTHAQLLGPGGALDGVSTFGEDEAGELYVASLSNGRVFAIDGPATARLEPGVVTGLWWNPAEPGWGVQFTQRGDAIFATLYTYGADGQPQWHVASNCARVEPAGAALRCAGALDETSGARFFGAAFDPSAVRVRRAGSIEVAFRDAESATMAFNVDAIARAVPLRRQVFRSRSVALAQDFTDLYYDPAQPGWGLSVSHQADILFLTWYVYDEAGRATWLVSSECRVDAAGTGCAGPLYRVTGPPLAPSFDASRVQVATVGQVSLAFSGSDAVRLDWTLQGVPGSRRLTRQVF